MFDSHFKITYNFLVLRTLVTISVNVPVHDINAKIFYVKFKVHNL